MLFLNNANKRKENAPYSAQVRRFAVSLHYTRAKYRDKKLIRPHVCLTIADVRFIIFVLNRRRRFASRQKAIKASQTLTMYFL